MILLSHSLIKNFNMLKSKEKLLIIKKLQKYNLTQQQLDNTIKGLYRIANMCFERYIQGKIKRI